MVEEYPSTLQLEKFNSELVKSVIRLDPPQKNKERKAQAKLLASLKKYVEGGLQTVGSRKVIKKEWEDWFEDRHPVAPKYAPFNSFKRAVIEGNTAQFSFELSTG